MTSLLVNPMPMIRTYCGQRVVGMRQDPVADMMDLYLEDGTTVRMSKLDYFNTGLIENLPVSGSFSSLHSQSEATIKTEDMSAAPDMTELCELLVEVDRKIAQHGGRFDTPIPSEARFEADTFDDQLRIMGSDIFSKGEMFKPHGLTLSRLGQLHVVMEVTAGDTIYKYAGLNIDQLEDAFPDVAGDVRWIVNGAGGGLGLAEFVSNTQNRLTGKPSLIALAQDYLKNGRDVISDLKAEQDEQDLVGFYEEKGDYGTF